MLKISHLMISEKGFVFLLFFLLCLFVCLVLYGLLSLFRNANSGTRKVARSGCIVPLDSRLLASYTKGSASLPRVAIVLLVVNRNRVPKMLLHV